MSSAWWHLVSDRETQTSRLERSVSLGSDQRDVFLSHRTTNKDFVRKLSGDIEGQTYRGRSLVTWVDEAEIQPGQSVTGMINLGLENSRFIGIVMTSAYFESESGWTDAEWHAALYVDPDNRRARILPLLATDCPYIPILLRHLRTIDFRGNRYDEGLKELLRVLREEPLPRPFPHRGQLIAPGGRVDRASLVAERSAIEAYPDVVNEDLYCNLLPVDELPQYVYVGPIARGLRRARRDGSEGLPSKSGLKETIRTAQLLAGSDRIFTPAFRLAEDKIVSFHDLEAPDGPLAPVTEVEGVEVIPTRSLLRDEDDRRLVISLLNMAVDRHCASLGLVVDRTKRGRFFFPPRDDREQVFKWRPQKRDVLRTVAKPCTRDGRVLFWRHLGAYLRLQFLANRFYLKISPTWIITEDGHRVQRGPEVGRLVIRWTGPERNLHVLYHVRFWAWVLRQGRGPISVRAGDQRMGISTVPAFVQQAYGIANDHRSLLNLLDDEASVIAQMEDELADIALETTMDEESIPVVEEVAEADVSSDKPDERDEEVADDEPD